MKLKFKMKMINLKKFYKISKILVQNFQQNQKNVKFLVKINHFKAKINHY